MLTEKQYSTQQKYFLRSRPNSSNRTVNPNSSNFFTEGLLGQTTLTPNPKFLAFKQTYKRCEIKKSELLTTNKFFS